MSRMDKTGKEITLDLVAEGDGETHLSDKQTTAIYNLFAVLDPDNTGMIKKEYKNLTGDKDGKAANLLLELKIFVDNKADKNGDNEVSFGEFLEQFQGHENPGDTEDINKLTEEFKVLVEKTKTN